MNERRAVAKVLAARYRNAVKKDKGRMLDEFVAWPRKDAPGWTANETGGRLELSS